MRKVTHAFWVLSMSFASFSVQQMFADGFKDIKLDLMNGNFLTAEELANPAALTFGVAIADDGTATRVAADDPTAAIVLQNYKFHDNQHGFTPGSAVVKVDGPVKISQGTCAYGSTVTVKDAAGEVVGTFSVNDGTCYHNSKNVVSAYYNQNAATTLTITGGSYVPYLAVEAAEVVSEYAYNFAAGDVASEGELPKGGKVLGGESFKIPANYTMYAEGMTLTGWSDGSTTYAIGEEVTPTANVTLTPVFTANKIAWADRKEAATVVWDFQSNNGAPKFTYQNVAGIYVAQATFEGQTIDVKMDFNTNPGKLNNGNWGDWAQVNAGTTFTVPASKGCTVSLESYSPTTTTTIAGATDYKTSGNVVSYLYGGKEETLDIVIGDGSYYRYVKVEYPAVVANIQERPIIATDFTNWQSVSGSNGSTSNVTISTNFSGEDVTFTFNGVSVLPAGQNTSKFGDLIGYAMAEKSYPGVITTSAFKNISRVRYYHGATGSKRGYKLEKKSAADADWVVLSDAYADPATGVWVESNINENDVQLRWSNLATSQNAYMFELEVYANVEITATQVSLQTAVSPEGAGTVSVSPASSEYDEGTEVTLSAKENFGFNFVNWVDAEGNVLSTKPTFSYVLNQNTVATAVFETVETYQLSTSVLGGAKDYMITLSPAAEVIGGKNMYETGTNVTITAAENQILKFTNWNTGETTTSININMDADKAFVANYDAVDYIVGWDFNRRGGSGRPADFASTSDNETVTLNLRDADGNQQAWLDKSQEAAGGYEGEPAAVNWKDINAKYYYETHFNATDFSNIRVTSKMLYNYNAYETQKLEYSLDGINFKTVATVKLTGAKAWTPVEANLPAECDHAATVYLRWIPDYTSSIVGASSTNDGTSITAIYVLADAKLINDGVAPKLVSSIPEAGAKSISAAGRIVLTFDEKVKLTETAKATLGGKELEATVAGKTVTFSYSGLDYDTDYEFVLAAGSIADLTDNAMSEALSIKFTTIYRPTVAPGQFDAICTTVDEFLSALETANANAATGARYRIFLHNGTYDLGDKCLTDVKSNISIIGESMEKTIIVNKAPVEGISVSATLRPTGENIYMQDITLQNAYDYVGTTGRAVCLQDKGNKNVYKNVRMLSYQDTYYSNNNRMRSYFEDSEIHGTVDFLCGGGDVFFYRTLFFLEDRSGNVISAPAGDTDWGYVFKDCTIDGYASNQGSYCLGRPWNGSPMSVWINTTMKVLPKAEGWADMSQTNLPKLFAEYNSHTENGTAVDCSSRKTTFIPGKVSYNPVLTAEEAAKFTVENVCGGSDNWQPNLLTEQVNAPEIAAAKNGDGSYTLSWKASAYALCYAICKNGSVVAFTSDATFDVTDSDASAIYSIRAVNEMGGLGLPSNEVKLDEIITGIESLGAAQKSVVGMRYYNGEGARINAPQSGLNVVTVIYSDGTSETVKQVIK